MTAIMGLLCKDGIILVSDSKQELICNVGIQVSKIYTEHNKYIIALAGGSLFIPKIINILNKRINKSSANLQKIIVCLEQDFRDLRQTYEQNNSEMEKGESGFQVILGIYNKKKFHLLEFNSSCNFFVNILDQEDYKTFAGSGFPSLMVLSAISGQNQPNIDQGIKISTFVMDNCIRIDSRSGVGYPIQITKMFLKNKKVVIEKLDKIEIDNLVKEMRDKTSKLFN